MFESFSTLAFLQSNIIEQNYQIITIIYTIMDKSLKRMLKEKKRAWSTK